MSVFTGDPVATASQHEQELAALELTNHPTVKAAYRSVAEKWLSRAKASDAMRERFDDAFAEVMFSAAVWSSNQDKLRPKVSCITRIGHPVTGRAIPDHVGASTIPTACTESYRSPATSATRSTAASAPTG